MNADSWNCTKSYPSNMEIHDPTLTMPIITYGYSHFGVRNASGFSSVDFQILSCSYYHPSLPSCISYPLHVDAASRIPVLASLPSAKYCYCLNSKNLRKVINEADVISKFCLREKYSIKRARRIGFLLLISPPALSKTVRLLIWTNVVAGI